MLTKSGEGLVRPDRVGSGVRWHRSWSVTSGASVSLSCSHFLRSRPTLSIVLCVAVSVACGSPIVADDAGTRDAARDGARADGGHEPVTVRITRPTSPYYTAGASVSIQVFVEGANPDRVDLEIDGAALVMLAPPYTYELAVGDLDEAEHEVVAVARIAGVEHTSEPLLVVIDRTPPTVIAQSPVAGAPYEVGTPLEITFSEPINPGSVAGAAVSILNGAGEAFEVGRSLSVDGTVLSMTLDGGPVSAAGALVARLATGVTDLAGNELEPADVTWPVPLWVPDEPAIAIPYVTSEWSGLFRPVARMGPAGELYLAASASGSPDRVVVFRRASPADAWERLAGGADCDGLTTGLGWDFGLDPAGRPTVVTTRTDTMHVCRWSGSEWEEIAPSLTARSNIVAAAFGPGSEMAIAHGSPLRLDRLRAGAWQRSPDEVFVRSFTDYSLAFDGTAYITASGYFLPLNWTFNAFDLDTLRATSLTEPLATPFDTDLTSEAFMAGDDFVARVGCQLARRRGSTWSSASATEGADDQACAAAPTASGTVILVSHLGTASGTHVMEAFVEVEGDTEHLGNGAAPIATLFTFEHPLAVAVDAQGPVVFYSGALPGDVRGIGALRLNLLRSLP